MPIEYSEASWWPPKVGDKLRRFTTRRGPHALKEVLAVFEHRGKTLATVAEWLPGSHQWVYDTITGIHARYSYWPDGQDPPAGCESEQKK